MSGRQGIDYAGYGATCNRDADTGVRYGVISCHSLHEWLYEQQEMDYGEATCPECGAAAIDACDESIQSADWAEDQNGEWACSNCQTCFESDSAYPEEALGWHIDDGEYKVVDCLDNDAMVIKSPYFTYAQFCSPCVPGACNLDNPIDAADINPDTLPLLAKCYCFGHDWFDGGRAPYPVYSVETGNLIIAEMETTPCPNCNGSGRDTVMRLAAAREHNCQQVRDDIIAGNVNVRDFDGRDTFLCFRCDGKGTQSEMVTREVQS